VHPNRVPTPQSAVILVIHHASSQGDNSFWTAILPGWTTAVATAGLLIGAIFTAIYAAKAFRKQSEQLEDQRRINAEQTEVLGLQASELRESLAERKREAQHQHRAQASRVYLGAAQTFADSASSRVINASDFPIYGTQLWYQEEQLLEGPDELGSIVPRQDMCTSHYYTCKQFVSEADALAKTILTFRDSASVRWVRLPDGTIEEQSLPTTRESVLAILSDPPSAS
jgi:hypothetical protein